MNNKYTLDYINNVLKDFEFDIYSTGNDSYCEAKHKVLNELIFARKRELTDKLTKEESLEQREKMIFIKVVNDILIASVYSKAAVYIPKEEMFRQYYTGEYDQQLNKWFIIKDGKKIYNEDDRIK